MPSLLETVSGVAVRHLNQGRIDALRNLYFSARAKLYPVMRAVYGQFDSAALQAHLEERLDSDFEILMVHVSVNHMQPMYTEGPLELVRMLMAFCGPNRTLAMPAFYFGDPALGGVNATFQKNPRFDLKRTPSQMGLTTELFRRMPGVVQSRHPVYRMAALGPLARDLTRGHEHARYPAGIGSPFDFMAGRKTLILGIGKTFQVLTQVHHVEGLMDAEFPVPRSATGAGIPVTVVDGKEEIPVTLNGGGLQGRFNIWKLRSIMDESSLSTWSFHHVPLFSTRANQVTRALVEAAKRGVTLYDPQ